MTNEPLDVGPAVGGDLPASEADKQQVRQLLNAARAEGRITAPEHTARTARVDAAAVFDDLVPLTRDLMPERCSTAYASPAAHDALQSRIRYSIDPAGAEKEHELLVGILGGAKRRDSWRVRKKSPVCVFGVATTSTLRTSLSTRPGQRSPFMRFKAA